MTFAYPLVLLLLVASIALVVREWRGHGQRVVLPFDHAARRGGRWLTGFVRSAQSLAHLLLAVVIVILAGPRELTEPRSKRILTNIEFCLDVSGSMTSALGPATRYDAAMEAINEFITYREGDAFGLTIFGSSVLHWIPLTSDPSAFRCATPFLRPELLPNWFGGGTMIGMALSASLKILASREEGDRMIILVSDGYSFDLGGGNAEAIARRLRDNGVAVYTIHVADDEGPPGELFTIADITGGAVFAAGSKEALTEVIKRIDQMRLTRIEKTLPETMDFYGPFCIAGLCALGLAGLALFGARHTPW